MKSIIVNDPEMIDTIIVLIIIVGLILGLYDVHALGKNVEIQNIHKRQYLYLKYFSLFSYFISSFLQVSHTGTLIYAVLNRRDIMDLAYINSLSETSAFLHFIHFFGKFVINPLFL